MSTSFVTALKRKLGLRSRHPLPHFLVLGTQKGGTTSLHQLLGLHPQIYLPSCKELHYFSLHDDQPISWYSNHFRDAKPGQLRGEITPYYLFHPRAPKRIRAVLPKAKLIVLLRDPVERALSQVFHAQRHGFEPLEIEEALAAEPRRLANAHQTLQHLGSQDYSHQKHSYVSRSRYEEQLNRYESLFPPSQILILRSEDLFHETDEIWLKIQNFLEIDSIPLPSPLTHANASAGEAQNVQKIVRDGLRRELFQTAKIIQQKYGIHWDWRN